MRIHPSTVLQHQDQQDATTRATCSRTCPCISLRTHYRLGHVFETCSIHERRYVHSKEISVLQIVILLTNIRKLHIYMFFLYNNSYISSPHGPHTCQKDALACCSLCITSSVSGPKTMLPVVGIMRPPGLRNLSLAQT